MEGGAVTGHLLHLICWEKYLGSDRGAADLYVAQPSVPASRQCSFYAQVCE
jgi:hypothetical protein